MRKVLFLLIIAATLILAPSTFAASKQMITEKIATLGPEEVVNGNYYAGGEIVEILGTVNGDVYAAGGQVMISGTINGDLIVAGGSVNISGKITDDVRAAGGQVTINADIGKNLSLAGGNLDISQNSSIGQAIQAAGGNILLAAPVGAEAMIAGGNITINSPIADNLQVRGGNLRLTPQAQVSGDLDYWVSEEATISEDAPIRGKTTKHELPKEFKAPSEKQVDSFLKGFNIFSKLISITTTLILGLILIKFFPVCSQNTVSIIRKRFWATLGLGLVTIILVPIIFLLLLVSVLGIPLAFILLTLFIIFLYYARVYAILALGHFLTTKLNKKSVLLALLLGIVAYYALTIIPIIGGLTKLFIILIGTGAGLLAGKKTYLSARKKEVF
jgi:hypothetical protein